jgi:hypothetical protein
MSHNPKGPSDDPTSDDITPEPDTEKLVENINEGTDMEDVAENMSEGADTIDDSKEELREDLKADSLGGATQVEVKEDEQASG